MRYCSDIKCAEEDWKYHKDFCRKKQEKMRRRRGQAEEKEKGDAGEVGKEECSALLGELNLD